MTVAGDWLVEWFRGRAAPLPSDDGALDANYFDEGWLDSLGVIELIAATEARFRIRFDELNFQDRRFVTIAGLAEMLMGRHENAVTWARKSHDENPRFWPTLRLLAACLAHLDRIDEARSVAREFLALQQNFSLAEFGRRYPLRDRRALELYIENLRKAGLPE